MTADQTLDEQEESKVESKTTPIASANSKKLDKKKKKKVFNKAKVDFKRKLSVDPLNGDVKFSNFNLDFKKYSIK